MLQGVGEGWNLATDRAIAFRDMMENPFTIKF